VNLQQTWKGTRPTFSRILMRRLFELYLSNDGQKDRVPNIDINGVRLEISSWKFARAALADAEESSTKFWATSVVPDLEHPKWYDPKRLVPTYDQIIVANGGAVCRWNITWITNGH
jgi:hypothetical protein